MNRGRRTQTARNGGRSLNSQMRSLQVKSSHTSKLVNSNEPVRLRANKQMADSFTLTNVAAQAAIRAELGYGTSATLPTGVTETITIFGASVYGAGALTGTTVATVSSVNVLTAQIFGLKAGTPNAYIPVSLFEDVGSAGGVTHITVLYPTTSRLVLASGDDPFNIMVVTGGAGGVICIDLDCEFIRLPNSTN